MTRPVCRYVQTNLFVGFREAFHGSYREVRVGIAFIRVGTQGLVQLVVQRRLSMQSNLSCDQDAHCSLALSAFVKTDVSSPAPRLLHMSD